MKKIFVKLRDTNGSFYIHSQGVSINRNAVVEVNKDQVVEQALLGKSLVETDENAFKKYVTERDTKNAAAKKLADSKKKDKVEENQDEPKKDELVAKQAPVKDDAVVAPKAFTEADAKELFEKALEAKKAFVNEDSVKVLTAKFKTKEEAVNALLNDENLKDKLVKALG